MEAILFSAGAFGGEFPTISRRLLGSSQCYCAVKWYVPFHWKISENFGKPRTYSSFSIPTEMTENFCTICDSLLVPDSIVKFFARLFYKAKSRTMFNFQCASKSLQTILLSLDIIALVILKDIIYFELFNFLN